MRKVSQLMFFSFVGVQLLGLFVGWNFIQLAGMGLVPTIFENPADLFNAVKLFAYIIFSVILLFAVLYFYKGKRLFLVLELLIIFASVQLFFIILLPEWTPAPDLAVSVPAILAVALRWKYPQTKTAFLLFSSAIVGPYIGAAFDVTSPDFVVGPAILAVLIFALYDVIAVFVTKHMVTLARELEKREAAFAVFFSRDKESVQLGTGDLVLPAILITSSLKLSLFHSLFALAGAAFGLIFMIYLLEKKRGYYPALPPIILFSLIFLAVYQLLELFVKPVLSLV
ncbi:hypothetical protein HY991_05235 [Candidatus Micrarchaeota archaeon]|nr:hypothetical protein [Candidatus Micrarchaeota archaeon]